MLFMDADAELLTISRCDCMKRPACLIEIEMMLTSPQGVQEAGGERGRFRAGHPNKLRGVRGNVILFPTCKS
jgi:hypothetical protein